MASAAVVFPEPLAPENRLTGPKSSSLFGTLPQFTNTNRLRNIRILRGARRRTVGPLPRAQNRLHHVRAHKVDNRGMDPHPGLRLIEIVLRAKLNQPQLLQPLKQPS